MFFTYNPPSHQIHAFPIVSPGLFIGGGTATLMWEVEGGTKSDVSGWVIVPEDESLKIDLDCGSFEGGCNGSWGRGIGEGGEDAVHKEHVREEFSCGWDLHSFKRRFRRRNVCLMFSQPHPSVPQLLVLPMVGSVQIRCSFTGFGNIWII